jgi:hypothetical protein
MGGARFYVPIILLIGGSTVLSQVVRRHNTKWVSLHPNETRRLINYEVTERFCSADQLKRCVFIKRHFDRKLILFYTHHRQILVTLGHRKQLVLINDWGATKSGKVVVVNLKSGLKRQIDGPAVSMYGRHAAPDRRLWIVPEAYEFSSDDTQVLIKMVKEDVSAATAEESIAAGRTYRAWWYAIDSRTGKVIHEYRTSKIPANWWQRRSRMR